MTSLGRLHSLQGFSGSLTWGNRVNNTSSRSHFQVCNTTVQMVDQLERQHGHFHSSFTGFQESGPASQQSKVGRVADRQ